MMIYEIPDSARIGIYWFYQEELFAAFTQAVEAGEQSAVAVDSTFSHWHEWEVLRERGQLLSLPEELRDEYDAIPRGRVLFRVKTGVFVILHGSEFSRTQQESVIDRFGLTRQPVTDEWDEHYDPLPEEFSFHEPS